MNRNAFSSLLTVLALTLFSAATAEAQAPALRTDLVFDKAYYAYGKPIGATVTVTSEAAGEILITEGFSEKDYYLYLRITGPSGKIVASKAAETMGDTDHAYGPLPVIFLNGRYVETAFCEAVPPGWTASSRTDDLRAYYDFSLPGQYSAEVLIAAATFKEAPCDANDGAWQGALRSKMKFIYVEGTTEVEIVPHYWLKAWQDGRYLFENLNAVIWPRPGGNVDEYDWTSITLNNVSAARVVKLYAPLKKKHYLLVSFSKQKAIQSLGPFEIGKSYPARVTGKFKTSGYFGGARQVQILGLQK
jgi:hypothetical protein